jgi:hypothetical protein
LEIRAEDKEENQSNLAGVRVEVKTPRFVAWFLACSKIEVMIEWPKIDERHSAGGQMKALRFVAWLLRIRALCKGVQTKGKEAKICS